MEKQAKLIHLAESELENQKMMLEKIEKESESCPKGHLETDRRYVSPAFYHCFTENGKRIRKTIDRSNEKDEIIYHSLRFKSSGLHNKRKIKNNVKVLTSLVTKYHIIDDPVLTGIEHTADPDFWKNETFKSNPYFPEHLKIETSSGIMVRSKTEAVICDALENEGISFRYEAELRLGSTVRYPDFTILHPKTHQIIVWEHNGRLNDPDHVLNYMKNIMLYGKYGFYPHENLIITAETLEEPFSPGKVLKVINTFFR